MITNSKQVTTHFHSKEFVCKCGCGKIYINEKLINNLETLRTKLNASKCVISSGYRCSKHNTKVGGSNTSQHTKGNAADCVFYDKNGKVIPSKIVLCAAFDLALFAGLAIINQNYTHLDVRASGTYHGDETKGYANYWTNPYTYFNVTKSDVEKYTGVTKTVEQLANEVIDGKHGNGETRKKSLGSLYSAVQNLVDKLLKGTSNKVKAGDTVYVTGRGSANANGSGAKTKYYKSKKMKVIVIKGNAYGCNQNNEGKVKDYSKVTAWFQANQIKK